MYSHSVLMVCLAALVAASCRSTPPPTGAGPADRAPQRPFDPAAVLKVRSVTRHAPPPQVLINAGSPEEAAIYAEHIKEDLTIPIDATLDAVLALAGYTAITASELETVPSDELMKRLPADLLAVRFFAPKIADVSNVGAKADKKDLGWRKVVRLRVRPGALADRGISSMFVLFNVFQPRAELAADPFAACTSNPKRCSDNNQVMLIVDKPQPGKDAAYWLVFKGRENGWARTDNLPATFDGGDIPVTDPSAVRPYYLPAACAECHGGSAQTAKLNYLDSDHWHDRIQDGDDFSVLRTGSTHGVLFDGGRTVGTPAFEAAFTALRSLNTEILEQNKAVGGAEQFQVRAVAHWLKLHEKRSAFIPPIERALPPPPSNPQARVWSSGTADDERLLVLLNRFCFRCHSSLAYHVFDKEAVFQNKGLIKLLVDPGFMPQDRKLDGGLASAKADILTLVAALK
jgi:hypothetical protein